MEVSLSPSASVKQLSEDHLQISYTYKRYVQLKQALSSGNCETIHALLDEGCPPNSHLQNCELRTPLHYSVYLGYPDIVKKLLDKGACINRTNMNNETALMLAAKFEKYDLADLLLQARGLENCRNNENLSHLHIACMRNQVDIVRKLIKDKADANEAVYEESNVWPGYTPLHFAVKFRCLETAKLLLEVGADITLTDAKEHSPLHLADMVRNEPMIDLLLSAHTSIAGNPANTEGLTHFHIACTRNKPQVVESFLKNNACISRYESSTGEPYDWEDLSPMNMAMYYECVDVVELLLRYGYRLSCKESKRLSSIKFAHYSGNSKIIQLLLQKDELENRDLMKASWVSQLHYLCIRNDMESIEKLSPNEIRSTLNTSDLRGFTPLHSAIENGSNEVINFLLSEGANCEIKNADEKTALHLAFDSNQIEIIDLLLDHLNHMENPADPDGISHLHIAATRENIDIVKKLVCRGEDIRWLMINGGVDINNSVNMNSNFWPGFTPLHFAAKFGSDELVDLLLSSGANYSAVDKHGLTAFDIALKDTYSNNVPRRHMAFRIMHAIIRHHWDESSSSSRETFDYRGFSLLHLNTFNDEYIDLGYLTRKVPDIDVAVPILNTPWDGYTALHFAMEFGDEFHICTLLEDGMNILCKAANGDTPLHLVLNRRWSKGMTLDLKGLVGCGENPVGQAGYSLFHVACVAGHLESVKYFLDIGVDPNLPTKIKGHDINDKTPLHLLVENFVDSPALDQVVKLLVERGADVNTRDSETNTPLHCINRYSNPKMIDLLVSHGADLNAKNLLGQTPLLAFYEKSPLTSSQSIAEGLRDKITSFLYNGADIDLKNNLDETIMTLIERRKSRLPSKLYIVSLVQHIIRLEALGFHPSKSNIKALNEILAHSMNRNDQNLNIDVSSYTDQCEDEMQAMSKVRVAKHTTLLDIMYKDLNELAMISENDVFQQIVSSDDFSNKFPIYGPMLASRLKRGQARRPFLRLSSESFNLMIGVSLLPECYDKIFSFLNNHDLRNIILAQAES